VWFFLYANIVVPSDSHRADARFSADSRRSGKARLDYRDRSFTEAPSGSHWYATAQNRAQRSLRPKIPAIHDLPARTVSDAPFAYPYAGYDNVLI
jgi:hypothetical protein